MIKTKNSKLIKGRQFSTGLVVIFLFVLFLFKPASASESCVVDGKKIVNYLQQNNFKCFSNILDTITISNIPDYKGLPLIHWAAVSKENSFLLRTLEAGANANRVNNVDPTMPTPIFFAIMSLNPQNVNLLITVGADLNVVNSTGWGPARYAANLNQYNMVLSLLKAGADWSVKDQHGRTLIDQIQTGRIDQKNSLYQDLKEVIKFLHSKGVAVHEPGEKR